MYSEYVKTFEQAPAMGSNAPIFVRGGVLNEKVSVEMDSDSRVLRKTVTLQSPSCTLQGAFQRRRLLLPK